jgi:hypothetical protein
MTHPSWPDLVGSPEVTDAVEHARSAVTALRRHPANRTGWPRTGAAASVRAARASAALDGAPLALNTDSETVTDPVLAGALRVAAGLGSLITIWPRAPLQALARLHTLAAADLLSADELGRPRMAGPEVGPRLARLAELVTTSPWPAPVQVALVHGELDPAGLGVPEVAHLRSGRRYLDLAVGSSGSASGVSAWIVEVCRCLEVGAKEGVSIADSAI